MCSVRRWSSCPRGKGDWRKEAKPKFVDAFSEDCATRRAWPFVIR